MRRITALLVAGLFVASLAVPAVVIAAPPWGNVVQVQPPQPWPGGNDTANIQNALNACVGKGPNCTVQLQPGTYHSSLLLASNFNGTFKGAGENRTTIQALPNLAVYTGDTYLNGTCQPNLTTCRLPTFLTFVNGNVEVSDLALDFPVTDGNETNLYPLTITNSDNTKTTVQFSGLFFALEFTGAAGNASVDRVSVTGSADHTSTNLFGLGFSVIQGISFDGWYPAGNPSFANTTRSGTFSVRNSTVRTVWDGVLVNGAVAGSQVTIGGSPWAGNQISDVDFGIDVGGANSTFDISYNTIAATNGAPEQINHAGVSVEPSGGAFAGLVTRLSQVSIHDNAITVSDACGCAMVGLWLQDANQGAGAPAHWFRATIMHNTISLPGNFVLPTDFKEGMDVNNITGTVILGNTITGSSTGAYDAISLWGNDPTFLPATNNVVVGNDVSGLTPVETWDPANPPGWGLSQYYLDPTTNHNLVVCTRRADTAYDAGTKNAVIGCTIPTLPAATGVSPLVRPTSPIHQFTMPRLHP